MSVTKERELLKGVYKTQTWALKVMKMSDAQVLAIFLRFRKEKKL